MSLTATAQNQAAAPKTTWEERLEIMERLSLNATQFVAMSRGVDAFHANLTAEEFKAACWAWISKQ